MGQRDIYVTFSHASYEIISTPDKGFRTHYGPLPFAAAAQGFCVLGHGVRELLWTGRLSYLRLGRSVIVRPADLEALLRRPLSSWRDVAAR